MKNFFQVGGVVSKEKLYIERAADNILLETLLKGEFCHVLAPRQIGKTSLAVRTQNRLLSFGVYCVSVDLNEIGNSVTSDRWFYSFLLRITEQLGLNVCLEDFWLAHIREPPPARCFRFFKSVVLHKNQKRFVIFIDEIDFILSVPSVVNGFFAFIRSIHEQRVQDETFERLTFCLLGVASPSDLMQDSIHTQFNIGSTIFLEDFTRSEAQQLLPYLEILGGKSQDWLDAIWAWTEGHPYMTLKTMRSLFDDEFLKNSPVEAYSPRSVVDKVVQSLFIANWRLSDSNLSYAEFSFAYNRPAWQIFRMLRLYWRLLSGETIASDMKDIIQQNLYLTGMVAERHDSNSKWLRIRNRIFATVFDDSWVRNVGSQGLLAGILQQESNAERLRGRPLPRRELVRTQEWARFRKSLTNDELKFFNSLFTTEIHKKEMRYFTGIEMLVACFFVLALILIIIFLRQ